MSHDHHIHVWSLDGESHVLTAHILRKEESLRDDVTRVKQRIFELLDPEELHRLLTALVVVD